MADSSLRLVLLLREIPREPHYISSQTLLKRLQEAGYPVSLRTIQRDMQTLTLHFPLVQNKPQGRGKTGVGWAFAANSQNISFPLMGSAAALTLMLATQHLQSLLPHQVLAHLEPFIQEAQNLLETKEQGKYRNWYNKVRIAPQNVLLPPQVDADSLALIYQALLESRQFTATYNGQPERIIHPYGLVQQGSALYLICRFYDYDDVRITALHRYDEVALLDEPVREFSGFRIDEYLDQGVMHWSPAGQIMLKLRLPPWLANHLQESRLSRTQKLHKEENGQFLLQTSVLDSRQLRRWLLAHGPDLEILQPLELREWMTQAVREQAEKYLAES